MVCGTGLETFHVLLRCLSQVSGTVVNVVDNHFVLEAWRQENSSDSEVPVVSVIRVQIPQGLETSQGLWL